LKPERHLIIHGHFYQPPRDDPWTGAVPNQVSAAPFPNWNARINRECYSPNTLARVLGEGGTIERVINNYRHISFNAGPTLMMWMQGHAPETYELIVEADRLGAADHGGHGPAIAQVFNHVIMPLALTRDKLTQVSWGRLFFRRVYGREPEGMWLAETAVDTESLGIMARSGIRFTILAQNQVDAVRPLAPRPGGGDPPDASPCARGGVAGTGPWEILAGPPDPREPYRVFWGPGPDDFIDVFIYDGPVSRAVAFENLLRDGKAFLDRIRLAFGTPDGDRPLLVNLATDGESYGHHFHFGEMALAWILNRLQEGAGEEGIRLTNYGEFLAAHPPRLEARIVEGSSWSCCHGVERWRADCGCRTGGDPSWNQKWRAPLREGLDWLRDRIAETFERVAPEYFREPWVARDAYGDVVAANYAADAREAFLEAHATEEGRSQKGRQAALEFMEAQLMSLYMFTSCGWFFDDIAGLEPVQNLRYASRAIALTQRHTPADLEHGLMSFLVKAIPNNRDYPTGAELWNAKVAGGSLRAASTAAPWAAAYAMNVPGALKPMRWAEVTCLVADRTYRKPTGQLPLLFCGRATLREKRLDALTERIAMVLADDGPRLDILVFETGPGKAPDLERAKAVFMEKGPQYLRSAFEPLFPGEAQFTLETLWPSVREEILTAQLKVFFDEIKVNTIKAFRNYRGALLQYSQKENAWDWMDRFIFRLMAEVELENVLKPMGDGRPVDLPRLKELIAQESGRSARNLPVIRESAVLYIRSLFTQLARGPRRPTLPEELLNFLRFVKESMPEVDLWEPQNLFYRLVRNEAWLFRALTAPDRAVLAEIGRILGFSERIAAAARA
jgi:hypothetical protein